MTIRAWDYLEEYEAERDVILAAVDRVFRSGTLILGPSVRRFEAEFAAYCGVREGVGVDNATNGLALALRALGIGAGDEVATVANTAVPTAAAIVQAGAAPRFVDVDPATGLMDPARLEEALTPRTRAVIPVHLYGLCADMDAIGAVARRAGLRIVEDCAQGHGAARDGWRAGSRSDLAVFSFYPTKPLGGYGDGGMIVTDRADLAGRLRSLRMYGMRGTPVAEEAGWNCRLDELHAEILRVKLRRLDDTLAARRRLARRYDRMLEATSLRLPANPPGCAHAYYAYAVRHPERDRIVAGLRERDVHVGVQYPWPLHAMPAFARFGPRVGGLPATEAHARTVFSLPLYPLFGDERQDRVCRALGEVLGEPVALAAAGEEAAAAS